MVKKFMSAFAVGTAALLALGACSDATSDDARRDSSSQSSSVARSSDKGSAKQAQGSEVSVDDLTKAAETAIAQVGSTADGAVVIDADYEMRTESWDIDVLAGASVYEVSVGSDGTATIRQEDVAERDDEAAATASVTYDQAVSAALDNTPGSFESVSWDDNRWDVQVLVDRAEYEVIVDATSGSVIDSRRD